MAAAMKAVARRWASASLTEKRGRASRTCSRARLAHGGLGAVQGPGDVAVILLEDVVQQEDRPLQRREPFQRQQKGDRDVLGPFDRILGERLDQRLRKPGAAIGGALGLGLAQAVDAKPRGRPDQPGGGIADPLPGPGPAQPGIL
jgi:hypothetical protein